LPGVPWANYGFLAVLLILVTLWVVFDRPQRVVWARRWSEWCQDRGTRRMDRSVARDRQRYEDARRQADLDAIYRHYRTSVRFYQAGGDPGELMPVWLPSKGPHPGASTAVREPESSSSQRPSW
jgi:hypothetical protein